jgi:NAD(P)-dependent dehydrogenase (short-subunit alcohol dehydrogenase family)
VTATNLARTNRLPGLGCLFDGSLARLPVRLAQMKGGHWSLEIAREGADVAFSYLSEHQDAKKTESLVAEAGRKAALLPGDIGERSISERIAREAVDAFGSIDILVNNAAFQRSYDNFEDISDDEFEETYRVNVFAMVRLCKALLPQMKPGGTIINSSSMQSFGPSPILVGYLCVDEGSYC